MNGFSGHGLCCIRGERGVFRGLDFAVAPGQALVLIGPNGSGKSSLLRLMAGLLRPRLGHLAWDGRPIADDPEAHRGRLHYVGHHDAVKPVLTVEENLVFWAHLHGEPAPPARVRAALEALAIGHLADLPGRFLSAGQRRRVNLARVLAVEAPLWLLDEPTTALDKATIVRLEAAIAVHQAKGGMVVASTHGALDLNDARELDIERFALRPGALVA